MRHYDMKKTIIALFCSILPFAAFASGNIENGKALAEKGNCAACHGKDFGTPIDPSYPKLAGQHQDYLAHALTAYKRGDKANGRANAIMGGQVQNLSTQDIKDLAAYLHSLPTTLVIKR